MTPLCVAIIGNSGSGKSTLARQLCDRHGCSLLELDEIVWEPGKIAVQRAMDAIEADLAKFLAFHDRWVIEGCYGELIEKVLPTASELVFLNPGAEVCLGNNRRRPWEPHKYASPQAQDEMLGNLLAWVEGYYQRTDAWSLAAHRRLFDGWAGRKREITVQ